MAVDTLGSVEGNRGEVVDGFQIQLPDPLTDDFEGGASRYEFGDGKLGSLRTG